MAAKKTSKSKNRFTFAFIGDGFDKFGNSSLEEVLDEACREGVYDEALIEVYELVPVGRYKRGGWQKTA